ncbi:Type II secretion system protein G precursor [Phycisphaerae bacterium RAS1]|nr:Type II secretion system protein G precursor [Phycisphaerae bacterium RAS1]
MRPARRCGFTLIELLIVVAILALLASLVLPSLRQARRTARATLCASNLHQTGVGLAGYYNENRDYVIPSYNMTGVMGDFPLDGWGPILDRDRLIVTPQRERRTVLYCPDTVDIAGVATGQTGADPENPKGWLDWPFLRTGTSNVAQTIPERNFLKILRVAYWINGDNPIGAAASVTPDLFYTGSVGYGPGTNGKTIGLTRVIAFKRPAELIALADGLYSGRQRDNQIGMVNSRIGYRHPGRDGGLAKIAFADGHVSGLAGKSFPRSLGGTNDPAQVRLENAQGHATVFANPERALGLE